MREFRELGAGLYVLGCTMAKPVSTDCSSLERILQLCHLRALRALRLSVGEGNRVDHNFLITTGIASDLCFRLAYSRKACQEAKDT